jgi:sugar phosphate isomerase/epimerase
MSSNRHYDQYVPESADRLGRLAQLAEQEGFTLVLENEKGIVTDTPERCLAVLQAVSSPALRFAWDPANFVQVGVAAPVGRGWEGLAPYIGYVHIKDARLADGQVTPAGEGDGQVAALLSRLKARGYQGTLSLEPHLKIAGHSGGFSGSDGMRLAAQALRTLMAQVGCTEV